MGLARTVESNSHHNINTKTIVIIIIIMEKQVNWAKQQFSV